MNIKRAALAVTLAAGLSLTGCAGMGGSGEVAQNDANNAEIEFWSNHPASSKALEEGIIKDFEAQNPGIKVKLVDAGKNYEEVAQKFNAALSGGQVPDVVVLSDVNWFNFALNGQLAPLDDLLKDAGNEVADYVPSLYDEYIYDGKHMAVPYARSTPLFYYNKDMWAKAGLPERGPKTWQEWNDDFAPKLKAAFPDKTPLIIPDGANYLDWYFQGMIWSMGGSYSNDWKMNLTSPESIKAGEFLQSQFKQGYFKKVAEATAPFAAGESAAIVESTGSISMVAQDGKVNFATAFLPTPDGVVGCSTGGSGIAIPKNSPNQAAAAKFVSFLTNAKNTVKFSQGTGYMPVRTSAVNDPAEQEYIKEHPQFKTALEQLPHTKKQDAARAYIPGGGQKLGAALDKIADGEDVTATFKALNDELQKDIDTEIKPHLK